LSKSYLIAPKTTKEFRNESENSSVHLKSQSKTTSTKSKPKQNGIFKNGRWTKDEHFRFLAALKLFSKEWKKVQEHVKTRTSTQARSHAQKFFNKLEKRNLSLEEFLRTLDLDNIEDHNIMSDLEDEKPPLLI
jgi:SHAQKYF class myb-like DNA-binding protein